ncbi:helix-turn-helix domain-containing protein [Variovorax sp. RHLX14]|uniref:helix-turn-helix domain-containing protein n=1 Tax=Variovorax sp. RHLX14 TaxID=1259731 RepID=UPI003F470903
MKKHRPARAILADNIRRVRASKGISQEQLAELAGLHRTYVSQLEREKCNITLDSLVLLATVLGMQAGELLTEP